ncbi:MAG: hypothetical protein E2O65_14920 [Gammaproteobacteria bacterium]|nr:MAG: hypothetical protein E2O65_14920 [Gammaproteobacteria bacterium]
MARSFDAITIGIGQSGPALEDAYASKKPSLLDVRVDPKELIIPPRITLEQAANFRLAKVKEFLN